MYEPREKKEEQNFWVSYADLMAGLLFVFILVVGTIVIKYVYVQTDLEVIKTDLRNKNISLEDTSDKLENTNHELKNKRKKISNINKKLKNIKAESLHLTFELAKLNNTYSETQDNLNSTKKLNEKLNENLNNKNSKLLLSKQQIVKITKILEDKNNNIKLLDTSIKEQKELIENKEKALKFSQNEITNLKDLLLGYELKEKEFTQINQKLENQINQKETVIVLKDDELELLTSKLLIQSKMHQKLVEEFDITKVKIKSLTGIRIKVITALKNKLGDSINIDPQSGAIKFSSNILFDQGSFILKEGAKKELSIILKKYISILLVDENIRQFIDNIVIQGHTNSDGSYLYNLELSQKRALEVMKFVYSLNKQNKFLLEKYVSASGRSYSDRIKDKNGFEEKDASRRIEIKFRIKNEKAIKQISNYLEK